MTVATGVRAKRGQPLLSRTAIVAAARAIVVEAGFDALTLRAVAKRLAVTPMPLYRHVESRDHLVALVVSDLIDEGREQRQRWPAPRDLEQVLRTFARRFRGVLADHPEVLQAFVRDPVVNDTSCAAINRVLEALTQAGVSLEQAVSVYMELFTYVIGFAALSHGRAAARASRGETAEGQRERTERTFAEYAQDRYPNTYRAREQLAALAEPDQFEQGLERFLERVRAWLRVAAAS